MNVDIVYLIIVIVVVLISMTLHEAMHAYTSYWLGDDTAKLSGRLTLNPIKHIDPFLTLLLPIMLAIIGAPVFGGAKPVPFNPKNLRFGDWGVAIVAIAGPLTNFILAFIAIGIWALIGVSGHNIFGEILITAASVNLGFFIFNIIPIPPLDGSRILYALAPEFVRHGMDIIEKYGIIIVFLIVMIAGTALESFMTDSINFFLNLFGHFFGL
jgi:Zn-dependent protease